MNHNLLSIQLILHDITQFLLSNVLLSYLRCYKFVHHWHCFNCLSIWYLNYLMSCNRIYNLFCPAFNEPIYMYTINTQKLKWLSLEESRLRNLLLELCTLMHKHDNSTSTESVGTKLPSPILSVLARPSNFGSSVLWVLGLGYSLIVKFSWEPYK